ncbi:MAG: AsmA family protein [Pseudomonadota bacterium]
MTRAKATRRWLVLTLVMLTWLVLGVSTPLVLRFLREGVTTNHMAVEAASRRNHRLLHPVALREEPTGLIVRSGVIGLLVPDGKSLTEKSRQAMLSGKSSELVLTYGEVALFDILARQHRPGGFRYEEGLPPDLIRVTPPLRNVLREGRFKSLTLKRSDLLIALPSQKRLRLRSSTLVVRPKPGGGFNVSGRGQWQGYEVDLTLNVGAFGGTNLKTGRVGTPISLSMKSKLFEVAFKGALTLADTPSVEGQATFRTAGIAEMARAFGISVAGLNGQQSLELSASTKWTQPELLFREARLSVGGQEARGALSLATVAPARPKLSGTLDFGTLDVARFVVMDDVGNTSPNDVLESLWAVLKRSGTTKLDMDIRVSADDLRFRSVKLGRSAASLILSKGVLKAHLAELTLAKGSGQAQISIDFNRLRPKVTVHGKLESADLAEITGAMFGLQPVVGTGKVRVDLVTYGTRYAGFARSLEGTIEVFLPDGGTVSGDLKQLNMPEDQGSPQVKPISAKVMNGGTTRVDHLKMKITVSKGRAFCEQFIVKFGDTSVAGNALIKFGTGSVTGRAVLRNSKELKGRGDSAIAISGTIYDPLVVRSPMAVDFEREVIDDQKQIEPGAASPRLQ